MILDKIDASENMKKRTGQGIAAKDEADRIYRAIFRTPISSKVKDRYYRAVGSVLSDFSPEENRVFTEILRSVSDLEALELAARRQNKMPLLISRFRLMVHLAESLPANQSVFINSTGRRISGYISLAFGGVRTLYKHMKGRILLRRAGDV
jgi:hypothetical protein